MNSKQNFRWKEMTMATCYYPEHWDERLWGEDLDRMREAGISLIRIAEFAWNKFEPAEGQYTIGYFDGFLDLCVEKGMRVIFGTPTATPPAWLTEKYPEVLNATEEGVLIRHGGRKHYNYNSPVYQNFCREIVTRLAEHYGPHPAIEGWQIDNELNCETWEFRSEADSAAFRVFLQKKYGTLDALNEAWGTVFWNETYTDWKEIYVPRPVLNIGYNPHLRLDYYRFISDSTLRFCGMQAEILRRYVKPGDYIMTNGMFWNVDNHRMEKELLDVYTYDSYPNFAFGLGRSPRTADDLNDRRWSKHLTEVRSICPHFGVMEQQAGAGGWSTRMESPAPRPGQLTLWAMQSVAQGADMISFFRWRTCTFGTEMYWHGILDYDNRDNRKLAEVKEFYKKLRTLDPVCGAENAAAFGVLSDYDNRWDQETDAWHDRLANLSEKEIFVTAELTHTPYDVIYLQEDSELSDLTPYPVLFYPHPLLMNEARAALLTAYVEQGGTLILGCRAGLKDMTGKCVMMPQPGLLAELAGTDVRDFTFAHTAEDAPYAVWNGEETPMPLFNDVLTPLEGTEVLARYGGSCYYAGEAALTEKRTGKGRTLHLGSCFDRGTVRRLLAYTGVLDPFAADIQAPEGVEVVKRRKDGREYYFVLNFQAGEESFTLKRPMRMLYTGETAEGRQTLPPYGTAVYEAL